MPDIRLRPTLRGCAFGEDLRAQEAGTTRNSRASAPPGIGALGATRLLDDDNGEAMEASPSSKRARRNGQDTDVRPKKMPDLAETRRGVRRNLNPLDSAWGLTDVVSSTTISPIRQIFDAVWPRIGGFLRIMEMCLPVALLNLYPPKVSLRAIVGDRRRGPYTIRDMSHLTGLDFCMGKSEFLTQCSHLLGDIMGANWHCAGIHVADGACVTYDSDCEQAFTFETSMMPSLGKSTAYRVSATPLGPRRPLPYENSPIGRARG